MSRELVFRLLDRNIDNRLDTKEFLEVSDALMIRVPLVGKVHLTTSPDLT